MENRYFSIKDTLYEITEKHPEAIELLVSIGFENMADAEQRAKFGKHITLEKALMLKKISTEGFSEQLLERIESREETSTGGSGETVKIAGVLPCPVKFPLMESFEKWLAENSEGLGFEIEHELKAASSGLGWLIESLEQKGEESIPDLFISAGFDLFFDKELFGKYRSSELFKDITGFERYNSDFENEEINLRDPDGHYSMVGVVPAVFLVNTEELDGREIPKSWEELLSDEFFNSVSLPIADFDLFNSILLAVYKNFGEDGVVKLGRILKSSMHPAEMVKSYRKSSDKPVVTIMPYFFTNMIRENDPMVPVWPEDGAIISPIFMLSKSEKSEKLKPLVDFFASKEVGEILSHNGRFPSVNPEVDNKLDETQKFMWVGWDFINSNDIGKLIASCEDIFNRSVKGEI